MSRKVIIAVRGNNCREN